MASLPVAGTSGPVCPVCANGTPPVIVRRCLQRKAWWCNPPPRCAAACAHPATSPISHRYALLAAFADGPSTITGYSTGADCASTLGCLRQLGVTIDEIAARRRRAELRITGAGWAVSLAPAEPLDAGNSGSTMRMLAGILAAHPFAPR